MAKATFAAGCFWGVEDRFLSVPGVGDTRVGYTGGRTKNPTYQQVCYEDTGHAEAVEVMFDPAKISFEQLLEVFWDCHDPTQLNRQGPDVGSQYRSAIFVHDVDQEAAAKRSRDAAQASGRFRGEIVTEIVPAVTFYPAEDYHQKYVAKQRDAQAGLLGRLGFQR